MEIIIHAVTVGLVVMGISWLYTIIKSRYYYNKNKDLTDNWRIK